jgi:hypothetical protein
VLYRATDNDDVESLGPDTVHTRLSQVAHNMAMHAVSTLNSMDNVTVLIILLCGGPERCPIDLTAPAVHETVPTPSNEGNSKAAGAMSTSSTYKRSVDYGGEIDFDAQLCATAVLLVLNFKCRRLVNKAHLNFRFPLSALQFRHFVYDE